VTETSPTVGRASSNASTSSADESTITGSVTKLSNAK